MVRLSKRDETWASLQFDLVNLIWTFYINALIITKGGSICYLGDKDRSTGGHWLFWVTELVSLWRFISVQRHGRLYVCAFDSGRWKHLRLTSVTESLASASCRRIEWIFSIWFQNVGIFLHQVPVILNHVGKWVQSKCYCYHGNMLML